MCVSITGIFARSLNQIFPIETAILRRSAVDREDVASLEHVGVTTRPKDLLVLPSPLRMIDTIYPVFDFHYDTTVSGDCAREVRIVVEALGLLERQRTVLAIARVDLERLLVRVDIDLDARPCGLKTSNIVALLAPVVGLLAGYEPGIICSVYQQ